MANNDDYNYIIKTIYYLDEKHNISFFITSSDFDVLYGWWIKRIPSNIVFESMDIVIKRWERKKKTIDGFKRFSYEVRKNFNNFMELKVSSNDNIADDIKDKKEDEVQAFINSLPDNILLIKNSLLELSNEKIKIKKQALLNNISKKLLQLHEDDPELKLKTKKFIMNLNHQIRTKEIEDKYRINYIFSKYKFPEGLLSFPDPDDVG